MNIRPLRIEDLDAVTAVHLERFPESRSTSLGKPFLRKMYRWFIVNQPELALVATIDGRVVGFAVGSIGGYGRQIFRYALPEITWGLVRHPKLILRPSTFNLWKSFMRGLIPKSDKRKEAKPNNPGNAEVVDAWFASLAVSRSAQGAGPFLIIAFERALKRKGAKLVAGTVLANNTVLRRVYENLGWEARGETPLSVGYRKRLS